MKALFYTVLMCLLAGCAASTNESYVEHITVQDGDVYFYVKNLDKPFNVVFLADSHITVEDERGEDYYQYAKRMGGYAVEPENYGKSNGREQGLISSLNKAKETKSELVILGGDIINFPSLASAELVAEILNESGLKWAYIAGNHDWHYEGEEGEAQELRSKWLRSNLQALYQGNNPLSYSMVINDVNFVFIDNSTFEITEEQLDFMRQEIEKSLPIVLSMHIPVYLKGHNIDYGCGHPDWNKENDIYYEIERREPWPEIGHTQTTFKFRELVLNSPEVIGIFAGHTHEEAVDFYNSKVQCVADANYRSKDFVMHFIPAE